MTIENHQCTLGLGSDSMLPKATTFWSNVFRRLRKLAQISQYHPETYDHFYSYPAVMAERQRHLYEAGSSLIHPFSKFSFIWNSLMILVNLTHMVSASFRLCYIVERADKLKPHVVDHILIGLYIICFMDVIIRFRTGYVEKTSGNVRENIIMDKKLIVCHYLRTWFLVDFLSSLPVAFILLQYFPSKIRIILVGHLLSILRSLRICSVINNIRNVVKLYTRSYIWVGVVQQSVVFLLSAHWCSCVINLPPVMHLYWQGKIPCKHTSFLKHPEGILHFPIGYKYEKSIFIAMSGFFSTGFSMFRSSQSDETLLHALVIIYSALFVIYNFVFMLKIYMTLYSSTMRYNQLMNQVEEYMKCKQFPSKLKKRVRSFYRYRFQRRYFSEDSVIGSLSEELRNRITLQTCYKMVNKVALFKDLPANVVGSVLGCLHPEVYLPNDSILRAGDIGECMYFIANGTVAVYSLKGVEVCHLEDGAHFGEVALIMKDSKRVATVVAVEITELYRLENKDFKQFILTNETLYHRIEAIAAKRMHQTVLLDEELQKDWEQKYKDPIPTEKTDSIGN